jgi:hypothetical protein
MAVENQTLAPFYSNNRNPYNYAKFEQIGRDISTQWLTTDELKQQINLYGDDSQDTYINSLELAVRMAIEDFLGLAIYATQWKVYYTNFGLYNTSVFLDLPEVSIQNGLVAGVTVNKVECYTNSNVIPELVDPATYSYDPTGNRIILSTLPNTLNQEVANPIVATYTQNANPLADYPVIKQAGLLLFTHLYNNRSDTTDTQLKPIPFGLQVLLRPYKPLVM